MEVTKFEDFIKLSEYGKHIPVWFVGIPKINKGYHLTDEYTLSFPIVKGYLHDVGYNRSKKPFVENMRFTSLPYSYSDKDDFVEVFDVFEDDTNTLNGRKIFTKENEAEKYWRKIRKNYLEEVERLNKKYTVKLSEICEKFGIDSENTRNKIVIDVNN